MIRRLLQDEALPIYAIIVFIGILFVMGIRMDDEPTPLDVEYKLEIINQDSVRIQNVESHRIYKIHIDSIQTTLQTDNI